MSGSGSQSGAIPALFDAETLLGDRYRIQSLVGSGGVGWVFLAGDLASSGQQVALKVIYPHLMINQRALRRFHREALVTMKLSHPNIVQTYGVGEIPNYSVFLVLEFLNGPSLRERINSIETQELSTQLRVLAQIAAAVEYAHRSGIIHRDLKPDNILFASAQTVKIADFGLASSRKQSLELTQIGEIMGTPLYMSPEQFRGELVDQRTDVYSFGIIAYELLTGTVPFASESFLAVAEAHCNEPLPQTALSGIQPWLIELICRCCEKSREDRFQTMTEILQLIAVHQPDVLEQSSQSAIALAALNENTTETKTETAIWRRRQISILSALGIFLLATIPLFIIHETLSPYMHAAIAQHLLRLEQSTGQTFSIMRGLGLLRPSFNDPHVFNNPYNVFTHQLPLLLAGLDPNFSDHKTGQSPLHFWLTMTDDENRERMILSLLEHGAQPDYVDRTGKSSFQVAIEQGGEGWVRLFIEKNRQIVSQRIGDTLPLFRAVELRQGRLVKLLIEAGADPDQKTANGDSARSYAERNQLNKFLGLFDGSRCVSGCR